MADSTSIPPAPPPPPAPTPTESPAAKLAASAPAPVARKPKTLYVVANPFHGDPKHPFDHNHRPNAAVPWDPDNHNPGRGFVGAVHRLDADGELYFEYEQFDHELKLLEGAPAIELPEYGDHGRSLYYLNAIRSGALLAADKETHAKAFGTTDGFVPPAQRLAWEQGAHERALKDCTCDAVEHAPKARPKKGEGRVGMAHAPRAVPEAEAPKAAQQALSAALAASKARATKGGV